MKHPVNPSVLRIVITYFLVTVLWIFSSDRLVALIVKDPALLTTIQTYKGWFFAVASSILLAALLIGESVGRKRVETALESSQKSFRHLFANNPNPMWVYDPVTERFLDVNDAATEKLGYSRSEFLRMTIADIQPSKVVSGPDGRVDTGGLTAHRDGVSQYVTKDGHMLDLNLMSHPLEYSGQAAALIVAEDVTERSAVESAYRDAETKRITAESLLTLDESRLEALQRLSQMDEATEKEIVDFALAEAVHLTISHRGFLIFLDKEDKYKETYHFSAARSPDLRNNASIEPGFPPQGTAIAKVIQERNSLILNEPASTVSNFDVLTIGFPFSRQLVIPVVDKDKVTAVAGVYGKEQPYNDADLRQLTLLMNDVCKLVKHNRMVEELRESQLRLKTAVESLPFDFTIRDQNGRYVLQNETSMRMWGNLIGKTDLDIDIPPELRSVLEEINHRVAAGEIVRQEVRYPGLEELGTFYNIVVPILEHGQSHGILGINIDITVLKQRERELEAFVAIANALRRTRDREKMVPIILDYIMEILGVDRSGFIHYHPETQEMFVELARGAWSHATGTNIPAPGGITEKVVTTGEVFYSNDLSSFHDGFIQDTLGVAKAGVCIPLSTNEQTRGVVWVGSQHTIAESDVNILKAIVDIAVNAINRATLNEQTSLQLQRLTALRSIDMAISSTLDVHVTLDILLNQITAQSGVDAAAVFLYQPYIQLLEFAAARGFQSDFPKAIHLRLGEGFAGQVALERRLQIVPDLQAVQSLLTDALRAEGEPLRGYLALPLIAKGQIKGVLELYQKDVLQPTTDWLDFIQALASQAAIAIDNGELFDQLQRSNVDLMLAYDATIEGWSRALELRDRETEGHTQRVTELTMKMIRDLGISEEEAVHIRRGVLLHDIGKMGIPDNILLKPGPLTEEEWKIMRKHPEYAYKLLSPISYLRASIDIPYNHHERWDGKGYPRGIMKQDIPLPARVFSIIDNWDALTSDRPYRKAWPYEKVFEYLSGQAGKRFDPDLVAFFLDKIHTEISTPT